MIDAHALLLVATLAASPGPPASSPTAADSLLASVVTPLLKPGDRLRVRSSFGVAEGLAAAAGPGGLQLLHVPVEEGNHAFAPPLAWSQIDRIERQTRPPGGGARVGAAVGALLGLATMISAAAYSEPGSTYGAQGGTLLLGGIVGAIAGGCAGALIGGVIDAAVPHWKTVYERR